MSFLYVRGVSEHRNTPSKHSTPLFQPSIKRLHLFEPRYRIMMRDLMQGCLNPQQSSSGGRIIPGTRDGMITPPMLLHLHRGNRLAPGETAMLVQVVFCRMYEHGNADVRLLPVCEVRMSRIWVRPNAGHLFCARVSRLPSGLVRSVSS